MQRRKSIFSPAKSTQVFLVAKGQWNNSLIYLRKQKYEDY